MRPAGSSASEAMKMPRTTVFEWRARFSNAELQALHAEAFGTSEPSDERDWRSLVERHSLGWVVARQGDSLVGFSNVLWDGATHAWLQDVMVSTPARRAQIGSTMVRIAADNARDAGCQFLHVDFDEGLRAFYLDSCGFRPSNAGLMRL
jgi:predicted N-acetyltransferase YhbS